MIAMKNLHGAAESGLTGKFFDQLTPGQCACRTSHFRRCAKCREAIAPGWCDGLRREHLRICFGLILGRGNNYGGVRQADAPKCRPQRQHARTLLTWDVRAGLVLNCAYAANFPRSVFTNRASLPLSDISRMIAE